MDIRTDITGGLCVKRGGGGEDKDIKSVKFYRHKKIIHLAN